MSARAAFHGMPDDAAYALVERRFRELPESAFTSSPQTVVDSYAESRARIDADVRAVKERLFAASLASRDDDRTAARWISAQNRRLARIAHRLADAFAHLPGAREQTFAVLAAALHYMGESVKGHIKESRFHGQLHALMRTAVASGRHREELTMDRGGGPAACTLSSLYFRALILARLAGGGLTFTQVEILDAWMWMWMPALAGMDEHGEEAVYRADLDSNEGLRCGIRPGNGPSLYLARAPIEAVRLAISGEFHRGRVVGAGSGVSRFAIADHFAALDAIRRNLRGVRHESAGRGRRFAANAVAELHVGLVEVMAAGAERPGPALALEPLSGAAAAVKAAPRERDHAGGEVRAARRRVIQLVDMSDTGVGIEGDEADCAEVAVDDLVALRLAATESLLLAKVVRRLPAATGGRVTIGLLRITSAPQAVHARRLSSTLPDLSLLYVPGDDADGRRDSYLTDEATAAEREVFETPVGDQVFSFRFNRVRECGRGWVLAGFEMTAARRRVEVRAVPGVESHFYAGRTQDNR